MIETVILNYLSQHLPYPVRMEHEPGLPEMYYIIEKTGGSETNHVHHSVIAIQSYAPTMAQAAQMNADMIAEMTDSLITEPDISDVSLNSNYNFTDTTKDQHRYQAVFDITHY